MKKVSIYTTPTCVYCKAAKEFFQKNGITYEEFDVSVDLSRRQEMIEKSGQMGVPVIMIRDEDGGEKQPTVIVGFDRAHLSEALGVVS